MIYGKSGNKKQKIVLENSPEKTKRSPSKKSPHMKFHRRKRFSSTNNDINRSIVDQAENSDKICPPEIVLSTL